MDPTSNQIKLSWDASCSVIDQPIGYTLSAKDKITGQTSYYQISKTVSTKLRHEFNSDVKYGTEYEFTVHTDVANSQSSSQISVKTVALPTPEALVTYPMVNDSSHEIRWRAPASLSSYLQSQMTKNLISYRVKISPDAQFKDTSQELVFNVTDQQFQLPMDKLSPGRIYYVGVALVDQGLYESALTGPIPLETPVPDKDLVVSPSGVAGVLVPIFIVILVLGSAVGYYMHRNRRLKRNFIAFASRYSPATGASILNTVNEYSF